MAYVTITDLSAGVPGNTYNLLCNSVKISGKRNTDSKPNANIAGPIEVQTLSYENLNINIDGIHYILNDSSYLSYSDVLRLYKHSYTGANKVFLNVVYGNSNITITTDSSEYSETTSSYVLKKTFTLSDEYVVKASAKFKTSIEAYPESCYYKIRFEYTDSSYAEIINSRDVSTYKSISINNPYPNKTVSSIKYYIKSSNGVITAYMKDLNVSKSTSSLTTLEGLNGTSTLGIPVILKGFNYPLSAQESKNSYMPIGSLEFIETA